MEECVRRVKIYRTDVDDEALREARTGAYPAKALAAVPEGAASSTSSRGRPFRLPVRSAPTGHLRPPRHHPGRADLPAAPAGVPQHVDVLQRRGAVEDRRPVHLRPERRRALFLGKAEMLLADGNRFDVVSMRHRMFRRRPGGTRVPVSRSRRAGPRRRDGSAGRRPQRQLRDLVLDTAPNAMIAVDMDGIVVQLNGQARARLGLAAPMSAARSGTSRSPTGPSSCVRSSSRPIPSAGQSGSTP